MEILRSVLSNADQEALAELIEARDWSTSAGDYLEVEVQIQAALVRVGYRGSEAGSQQLFERLFVHVFRRLDKDGLKGRWVQEVWGKATDAGVFWTIRGRVPQGMNHRSAPYTSMSSNFWPSTPAAPPLALQHS
jgi:hypothetical protein